MCRTSQIMVSNNNYTFFHQKKIDEDYQFVLNFLVEWFSKDQL